MIINERMELYNGATILKSHRDIVLARFRKQYVTWSLAADGSLVSGNYFTNRENAEADYKVRAGLTKKSWPRYRIKPEERGHRPALDARDKTVVHTLRMPSGLKKRCTGRSAMCRDLLDKGLPK